MQFLTDAGQYVIRFGDIQPNHSQQYIASDDVLHTRGPLFTNTQKHSGVQEMQQLQTAAEQVTAFLSVVLYSVCSILFTITVYFFSILLSNPSVEIP